MRFLLKFWAGILSEIFDLSLGPAKQTLGWRWSIQDALGDLLQALDTAAGLFHDDELCLRLRQGLSVVGVDDDRHRGGPGPKGAQQVDIDGIGKVRVENDEIDQFMGESPLKKVLSAFHRQDPVAFLAHLPLQKTPNVRVAVGDHYGEHFWHADYQSNSCAKREASGGCASTD